MNGVNVFCQHEHISASVGIYSTGKPLHSGRSVEEDVSLYENIGLKCSADSLKGSLPVFQGNLFKWVHEEIMRKSKEGSGCMPEYLDFYKRFF